MALPHGPVPPAGDFVLDDLKRAGAITLSTVDHGPYKRYAVSCSATAPKNAFSKTELEIIDRVCRRLGRMTAVKLSQLSHLEPAWKCAVARGEMDTALMHYGPKEDPEGL